MSGIAHFLETEGIATTLIALLRPHIERAPSPRALWVPFQLGRPAGAPGNPEFQTRVLRHALSLLERDGPGPILEEFPDDEPGDEDVADWEPPFANAYDTIPEEVAALKPMFERSFLNTGRTTTGICGTDVTIEMAAEFIQRTDTDDMMQNPLKTVSDVQMIRYAADDLKAYYLEAAVAGSGVASAYQLGNWFWRQTVCGRILQAIREQSFDHQDKQRQYAAMWLVPQAFSDPALSRREIQMEIAKR